MPAGPALLADHSGELTRGDLLSNGTNYLTESSNYYLSDTGNSQFADIQVHGLQGDLLGYFKVGIYSR